MSATPANITIEVKGHLARITPQLSPALEHVLQVPLHRFEANSGGVVMSTRPENFFWHEGAATFTKAGLVPRLINALRGGGTNVEVLERTAWLTLLRADSSLGHDKGLSRQNRKFADIVTRHARGQILTESEQEIGRLAALMLCVFPRARIFVAARNKRRVRELRRQIGRYCDRPIETDEAKIWSMPNRVFVGTANTFTYVNRDDFDIFIFADVESVLSKRSHQHAQWLSDRLFYCFRSAHQRLDRLSDLRLESICGDEIFRVGDLKQQPTQQGPPRVLFATVPLTPMRLNGLDPLERKRRAIWHNAIRNRAVADLAEAFSIGNIGTLWNSGLLLNDDGPDAVSGGRRTVVLVEGPEHGRELVKLLPNWELLSRGTHEWPVDEDGCVSLPTVPSERAVVTQAYAEQYGIWADVLIQAHGTSTSWRSSWGQGGGGKDDDVFVVDLLDDVDEHARQQSLRRVERYLRKGLPVEGHVVLPRPQLRKTSQEGGEVGRE